MGWVKIDDHFADHPKVLRAGTEAVYLFVMGLCYASRYRTDGFIHEAYVTRISGSEVPAARLVEVGLWERAAGGYEIHDYLDYNLSKQQAEALSEKRRLAGQAGGKAKGEALATATPKQGSSRTRSRSPSQNPVPNPEEKAIAPAARERDPIWDVLVELYGETEPGDGKRNVAVRKLRTQATVEEIKHRYEMLIGTDESWAVVTPNAMAQHFGNKALLAKQGRTKDRASQIAAMAESMRGSKRKALPS